MFRYNARLTKPRVAPASKPRNQRRSIVHATSLYGIHSHFSKNDLRKSFLRGMVLANVGGLENLYDFAILQKNTTAIQSVIKSLFYKVGSGFRPTYNKSLPAFSLTPEILGNIMHYLKMNTLDTPDVRTKICAEWGKTHLSKTGTKISLSKANDLLDNISAAKKEDLSSEDHHFTEAVLFGFLYHRATTRQEILDCLLQLDKLAPILEHKLNPARSFKQKNIEKTHEIIKSIEAENSIKGAQLLKSHYEKIILALLLENQFLQQVTQTFYGYEGLTPIPNCMEVSIHNICNFILYDTNTNQFNFKLLPASLQFNQDFFAFYQMQDFHTFDVNTKKIGQTFMNLLSGKPDIFKYNLEKYELHTTQTNFIAALNFLFGTTATSVDELSIQLSTDKRKIEFSIVDSQGPTINITTQSHHQNPHQLTLALHKEHAEISSDFFHKKAKGNEIPNLLQLAKQNIHHDPSLLSLLIRDNDEEFEHNITAHLNDINKLNFINKYFIPTTPRQAYLFIKASTCHIETNSEHKNYVGYLFKKFDFILHLAIKAKNLMMVHLALQMGINVNALNQYHETPLHISDNVLILSALINAGADVNAIDCYGASPLHHAITWQNLKKFKLLLANNTDPFVVDANNNSMLCIAFHPEMLAELLKLGLDPNQANKFGSTPLALMMVQHKIDSHCMEMLFKAGANPNSQDKDGCTPLHNLAGQRDSLTILSGIVPLLAHGANPNIADNAGNTPLHIICHTESYTEIANILIDAGANPLAKNLAGQTPYDISQSNMRYLLEKAINKASRLTGFFKYPGQKSAETPQEKVSKVITAAIK